ncbi:MAG TPA: hypothetical protein VJ840_06490 [Gemmatimonadaceae bacterium]|nr:hypothetical protein [Gemmatimonadaceae bacterium]
MSPNRAAAWDPATMPIVTAIEDPLGRRRGNFLGYLSPSKTIELPEDGRIGGPILVVLGMPHPTRLETLRPPKVTLNVINAPPPKSR